LRKRKSARDSRERKKESVGNFSIAHARSTKRIKEARCTPTEGMTTQVPLAIADRAEPQGRRGGRPRTEASAAEVAAPRCAVVYGLCGGFDGAHGCAAFSPAIFEHAALRECRPPSRARAGLLDVDQR
jgi:hypothetical protein